MNDLVPVKNQWTVQDPSSGGTTCMTGMSGILVPLVSQYFS